MMQQDSINQQGTEMTALIDYLIITVNFNKQTVGNNTITVHHNECYHHSWLI